jgi:hypothetical protein
MRNGRQIMVDRMSQNQQLNVGHSIISQNGQCKLVLQSDGNLVLYWLNNNRPLWASNTLGRGASNAVMQSDGNFVLYKSDGTALWASGTNGNPGAVVVMQNDGNLVVYSRANPLWASGTSIPPPPPQVIDDNP